MALNPPVFNATNHALSLFDPSIAKPPGCSSRSLAPPFAAGAASPFAASRSRRPSPGPSHQEMPRRPFAASRSHALRRGSPRPSPREPPPAASPIAPGARPAGPSPPSFTVGRRRRSRPLPLPGGVMQVQNIATHRHLQHLRFMILKLIPFSFKLK
ncbi:vegetative cell wall protein gp1 isoform X2 [Triticum aestivum]|uniref:vegetative cell wall protein gp1 isoform X2 n=1 Tax=Triticum aestivum TaxID=4565 RepID=UPI001D00697B|nr:vegetative cell wall protein gp1-like isoform X2 [Triticum aestivum]